MKVFNKLFNLIIVSLLTVSLVACQAEKQSTKGSIKDGTYTSTVKGHNDNLTIEVKVLEQKIASVEVKEHKETPVVSDLAINDIPKKIVETQSLNVDTISGATVSSKAILEAASNALKEAGFDVEKLKTVKVETKKEEDKEVVADVIVIGAGGAGLAAAVSANQEGASVIVIEKMPKTGGNTILAGGALNASGPQETRKEEKMDNAKLESIKNMISKTPNDDYEKSLQETIKKQLSEYETSKTEELFDSKELHALQTYSGGDYKGNPELVSVFTDNTWKGVEWLQSLGMEFKPGVFTVLGGLWPRAHKPVEPVGTGFFKTYQKYIDEHDNVEIMLNTKAEKLIYEDDMVKGVEAIGETGNKITLRANKAVVLASGGFGNNVELRQEYNTIWKDLGENIKSTNHPGATGDGIKLAKDVNADFVGMEYIQLLPMGDPKTGSLSGNIEKGVDSRIFVNNDGNRFVDEGGRRDVMTAALIDQKDSSMWVIMDSHYYPTGEEINNFNEKINTLVEEGRAFKGETLEDLAKAIGVDSKNLTTTVEQYNRIVKGEEKDPFNRSIFGEPIDKGPFYAAKRIPTVHHTMGGVKINTDAQVIDTKGNVIKGLYAAGEVTGGIHGSNRLGGNALSDILVFGRIAGKNAATK